MPEFVLRGDARGKTRIEVNQDLDFAQNAFARLRDAFDQGNFNAVEKALSDLNRDLGLVESGIKRRAARA